MCALFTFMGGVHGYKKARDVSVIYPDRRDARILITKAESFFVNIHPTPLRQQIQGKYSFRNTGIHVRFDRR